MKKMILDRIEVLEARFRALNPNKDSELQDELFEEIIFLFRLVNSL